MSTPATAPKAAAEILRLLVAGKTAQQAADLTGWPRHRVVVLVQSTPGWMLDPNKDTVYQPDNPGMVPRLPDGIPPAAPRLPDPARTIDTLLTEAQGLDDKAVQRELGRIREGITRLRAAVATVTERRQVEQKIAALEQQLAESRARAKELGIRTTTTKRTGRGSTKEIRDWAAEHGIECSPRGKIPAGVQEQYDAWEAAS